MKKIKNTFLQISADSRSITTECFAISFKNQGDTVASISAEGSSSLDLAPGEGISFGGFPDGYQLVTVYDVAFAAPAAGQSNKLLIIRDRLVD